MSSFKSVASFGSPFLCAFGAILSVSQKKYDVSLLNGAVLGHFMKSFEDHSI